MGSLSLLRSRFHDVRLKIEKRRKARGKKKDDVAFSAEEEILRDILLGRERLRMHVHKIDDIAALLRLADEFALKLVVEHTCDVNDGHIYMELKRRRIPVVFGPLDSFAYKVELRHENWRNIRHLIASGVQFGLMTDHPVILQNTLLMTLRWFLRCGLTKSDAIEIVTRRNAEILGAGKFLGTLERGKWASFVAWNGDPFELASHPVAVWGEGVNLYSE
jgi:imidazolonepropionase-like amidohydrolase